MPLLSEVAELIMGQSPPSSSYNENGEGLPFFQGKVDFGFIHPIPRKYCTDPKKISEKGDILISVRAPVGPTNICSLQSCIGRGLAVIRPKDVDGMFLYFLLKEMESQIASLGTGSTFKSINKSQLSNLSVNTDIFTRPEQRRIAAVLSAVQRAIEQQEELIARTTELKKALMHTLFTEGTRGEPQKETEIGPVPESWELRTIDDLFETQLGKMLSKKAKMGVQPKPYIRNKNVQWGIVDTSDLLEMDFNEREQNKFRLKDGDLLVCEGGEPGRAAIWQGEIEECYYQKAIHRIRPREETISNQFLLYWLWYSIGIQNIYDVSGASSTIAHLPAAQLKNLIIPVPSVEVQNVICETFLKFGDIENSSQIKRNILGDLFHTLLHQLMTAEVRVDEVDLSELREIGIVVD